MDHRVRESSKGQVVIPRQLRRALNIRAGTEVTMERRDDESFTVRLAPEATLAQQVDAIAGILALPGRRKTLTDKAARALMVRRARAR